MRLEITPQPTADEAAAIDAALQMLASERIPATRRLRYGGLRSDDDVALTWIDLARLEALSDV
jgi:hypothetical protein